jgi:hypothetical protein
LAERCRNACIVWRFAMQYQPAHCGPMYLLAAGLFCSRAQGGVGIHARVEVHGISGWAGD